LQKSLAAEADGAVHMKPATKAAAALPTAAIDTLVFMLGSFSLEDHGTPSPLVALAEY
jgi:hypothetical protein